MARYDYRCPACHLVFEVEHGMNEKPKVVCPQCGTEASRVFEATGITLKGSGFYNTDMRDGQGSTGSSAPHPASETASEKGAEGAASADAPSSAGAASASHDASGTPKSEGASAAASQ